MKNHKNSIFHLFGTKIDLKNVKCQLQDIKLPFNCYYYIWIISYWICYNLKNHWKWNIFLIFGADLINRATLLHNAWAITRRLLQSKAKKCVQDSMNLFKCLFISSAPFFKKISMRQKSRVCDYAICLWALCTLIHVELIFLQALNLRIWYLSYLNLI